MAYAGTQSDIEGICDWVLHPFLEEDQVVSCTPKTKSEYNLTMPLSPTRVSADEEPFEDEEEPSEEEHPGNENGRVPTDTSPYPYSIPTMIVRRLRRGTPPSQSHP